MVRVGAFVAVGVERAVGEQLAPAVGDRVDPLAAGLGGGHEAAVLEHLQGRVDRTGAGPEAAPLLDRADQLVAVARAVGQRLEDQVLHVAAARAAAPAAPEAAPHEGAARLAVVVAVVVLAVAVETVADQMFYHVAIVFDISL